MQVDVGDPTGLLDRRCSLPARTGRMLGSRARAARRRDAGLEQRRGHRGERATGSAFSPGLGERTEVWLRTDRAGPHAAATRVEGDLTVVTASAGTGIELTFAG